MYNDEAFSPKKLLIKKKSGHRLVTVHFPGQYSQRTTRMTLVSYFCAKLECYVKVCARVSIFTRGSKRIETSGSSLTKKSCLTIWDQHEKMDAMGP